MKNFHNGEGVESLNLSIVTCRDRQLIVALEIVL